MPDSSDNYRNTLVIQILGSWIPQTSRMPIKELGGINGWLAVIKEALSIKAGGNSNEKPKIRSMITCRAVTGWLADEKERSPVGMKGQLQDSNMEKGWGTDYNKRERAGLGGERGRAGWGGQ